MDTAVANYLELLLCLVLVAACAAASCERRRRPSQGLGPDMGRKRPSNPKPLADWSKRQK